MTERKDKISMRLPDPAVRHYVNRTQENYEHALKMIFDAKAAEDLPTRMQLYNDARKFCVENELVEDDSCRALQRACVEPGAEDNLGNLALAEFLYRVLIGAYTEIQKAVKDMEAANEN